MSAMLVAPGGMWIEFTRIVASRADGCPVDRCSRAAPLQSAFTQIGEQFKAGNPGVNVNLLSLVLLSWATQPPRA